MLGRGQPWELQVHRRLLIIKSENMEIVIRGHLAASRLLVDAPGYWDCIAIIDSDSCIHPNLRDYAKRVLVLTFDDIEMATSGKIPPGEDHIRKALSFALESERLLVSCRAGQSRSAAVALLIASRESSPREALAILDPERHRPNLQIVKMGNAVLDIPSLYPIFLKWRSRIDCSPIDTEVVESEIARLVEAGVSDIIARYP